MKKLLPFLLLGAILSACTVAQTAGDAAEEVVDATFEGASEVVDTTTDVITGN